MSELITFRPLDHGRAAFIRLYSELGFNAKLVMGPECVREVAIQIMRWIDGGKGYFCDASFN